MDSHWHIIHVAQSLPECINLFWRQGFFVQYPVYHRQYPLVISEAAAYFGNGHGAMQSVNSNRILYKESEFARYRRSLISLEAQTQIVLVTGDQKHQNYCFRAWQRISKQLSIVHRCPHCNST